MYAATSSKSSSKGVSYPIQSWEVVRLVRLSGYRVMTLTMRLDLSAEASILMDMKTLCCYFMKVTRMPLVYSSQQRLLFSNPRNSDSYYHSSAV